MARIVHLSDLHFGAHDPRLVEAVEQRIDDAKPDLTVISGDFTQRARTEQFEQACQFLDRLKAAGHEVLGVPCDVADEASVAATVRAAVDAFGRLDMAFNNAGIQVPPSDAADEPAEVFDRVNAINLRGVWASMKHELAQMRTQGSGAIVNCSSLGGLVGIPGRAAYHASKHGVLGLTSSAALEYAPRGIRINDDAIETLRNVLIPRASLLTPNLPEAAKLLDESQATDEREMSAQAEALKRLGASFRQRGTASRALR